MAPLTRATGTGAPAGFTSINPSQQSTHESEVIEIEDDDDESMDDEGDALDPNDDEEEEDMEDDYVDEDEESEDESADVMNGSESPLDLGFAPNGHNGLDIATPDLFTSAGAQEALHPLRRTADRVTRQIEAFAEKLDRFKQKGNRSDEFVNYQAAYQLVKSYQTLAQDAISDISKQNTLKRAKLGLSAARNNGTASLDPKTEEELQRLQLEADTWRLLLNLISIDDPPRRASAKKAQETVFQNLHRYSSDREVWEQFLSADHYATECVIVLKWLENTAKTSSKDMDLLITELETQAERGQGLWSHGWLYTKEAIKGQKRLRAWPQPLDPNNPGISDSLLSSDKSEPLVTQLDPDAVTRQKHSLQTQDQFYERATWMTCWKMLRHGESWSKIREWCAERLENWRAVSICGSSVDVEAHTGRTPVYDGHTRMMNWRSQESWRAACAALTRSPHTEDFERAVYSLLCGETEAAFKVCHTWDDYLYVYFNSVLLSRYQGFCKQFQRKLSHSPTAPVSFVPEPAGYAEVNKFVQYTRGNDRVGSEARNPYRTIQATILGKGYDSFFYSLAQAVSQVANSKSDRSSFVPDVSPTSVDDSLVITAEDGDALRIATHLYIVTCSIGYVRADTQFYNTACVNVIGYIANLEEAGVVDIIPIYASLLPEELAQSVLAQVLIEIVDPRERRLLVRLMEKHGIDVEAVLQTQWEWVSANVSAIDHSRTVKRYPKVVTRKDGNYELVPVKKDFIGTEVSETDEQVIRSLEWLRYVDGQWGRICQLGALLYRKFYISGRLSAARELSRRMRLSDLSREAFGFDISEFTLEVEAGQEFNTPEPSSPSKSRLLSSPHKRSRSKTNGVASGSQTSILIQQSQTMRDLEVLILAFDSLERFATVFEKLEKTKRRRDAGTLKDLRGELQEALDDTSLQIDAMLDEWLVNYENEADQAELEQIRNTYLPEVFLDYHSAMYYSAHVLTSELLVQCMNLATQVAEVEHLTSSFVASRRVGELVNALALSSKAMVNTRAKPGVRLLGGESLGIWTAEAPEEENGTTQAQ
ncbi:nuclear pore complex protein An-Nup84 [Aspergillus sclerotioniger CBS 115572]|uniref:Nuclear pore complex protein n=1 Tax=Aspergillus sclerotioniger CBS 115572 TaxID=1450535 RepID=A0A317WA54_9EURO|nr:nuclear pore complex protein An-Nup84 [Aspergillus sclerotioniger CBS 115572]PWY83089.1 nuclear pore complex protein An-Nup84 [Aspergillus sclerotioniger CBS 115572]